MGFRKEIIYFILFFFASLTYAKDIVISRNFVLFTSQNLNGYLKPIFTSLNQSLNNALFGTSNLDGKFKVSLNLAFSSLLIPEEQKWFDAEVPEGFFDTSATLTSQIRNGEIVSFLVKPNKQPTIYGGSSVPIFAAPQNHKYPDSVYKTIAYPEGLHLNLMIGLPVLQLIFETPLKNEIRFRFFTMPIQGESFVYLTIGFNQRIDHLFEIFGFDKRKNISIHTAFHRMYRGTSFSLTSYAIGINVSNQFNEHLIGYLGVQHENLDGYFKAIKDTTGLNNDIVNSPFLELREARPVAISFQTYTKWQIKGGLNLLFSFGFVNFDLTFASQPMISLGFGLFLEKKKK
ncbi:MAG: hypothetical protein CH6_1125 [Candidatus Kapaibacterium sp.]|nr:MAG: hypothetical protein CH6_1125 [Candidatus Kapabacteria bacterium]